eukprot:9313003-Alexandrium_andersonii.AAC.1
MFSGWASVLGSQRQCWTTRALYASTQCIVISVAPICRVHSSRPRELCACAYVLLTMLCQDFVFV